MRHIRIKHETIKMEPDMDLSDLLMPAVAAAAAAAATKVRRSVGTVRGKF